MENEDETKTHLHVGYQGERGMTGASFATVIPGQGTPASHQGVVSVVVDQRHHTNPQAFLPQRVEPGSSTDPDGALHQGRRR